MKSAESCKLVTTLDGSHTLYNAQIGEHYHSTFGALQESEHIFIRGALDGFKDSVRNLNVLEIGFGTGLNALLTFLWAEKSCRQIKYHGIEAFPISRETARSLNYHELLQIDQKSFLMLHDSTDKSLDISDNFRLTKEVNSLEEAIFPAGKYDVIYFDAFSPEVQPELWKTEIFKKLYDSLKNGGVMTTYSCKGDVKRSLKAAGFSIEKLPGPPGKREILKAKRI